MYERVKGDVWTSLLPLIDHTKIEYGDEEADAEVQLPLDSAVGEEGSIESIPGDAELEAELGVDGEGDENEDGGADGDGEMGSVDGGDGGHEGGQERVPPLPSFTSPCAGQRRLCLSTATKRLELRQI